MTSQSNSPDSIDIGLHRGEQPPGAVEGPVAEPAVGAFPGPELAWNIPVRERLGRDPEREAAAARAASLQIVDLRTARCRMEFFDIGAVVYILRKYLWWVPDFTVERYRDTLERLDAHIREHGAFVAHSTRSLVEARRAPGSNGHRTVPPRLSLIGRREGADLPASGFPVPTVHLPYFYTALSSVCITLCVAFFLVNVVRLHIPRP